MTSSHIEFLTRTCPLVPKDIRCKNNVHPALLHAPFCSIRITHPVYLCYIISYHLSIYFSLYPPAFAVRRYFIFVSMNWGKKKPRTALIWLLNNSTTYQRYNNLMTRRIAPLAVKIPCYVDITPLLYTYTLSSKFSPPAVQISTPLNSYISLLSWQICFYVHLSIVTRRFFFIF